MIFGDCDNNFVFISPLHYTIYAYFFYFLGYKLQNQKIKAKTEKTFDFEKNLFFALLIPVGSWHPSGIVAYFENC